MSRILQLRERAWYGELPQLGTAIAAAEVEMKVAICLTTVNRPVNTLSDTLGWMKDRDPVFSEASVAISVGSEDESYLPQLHGAQILSTTGEQWGDWGHEHPVRRLTHNLLRAHEWLAKSGADLCVFAEDDIEVAEGWLGRLGRVVRAIGGEHHHVGLCGCSSHPMWCFSEPTDCGGGDAYVQFKQPKLFWGNQLLAYPAPTCERMAAHLRRCTETWRLDEPTFSAHNFARIGDQATKNFFVGHLVPLFVTIPSLARHTGATNSWSGGTSHAFRDHPTARFA